MCGTWEPPGTSRRSSEHDQDSGWRDYQRPDADDEPVWNQPASAGGAQLAAELTNNTIWLFSSGGTSSASLLSYQLTQPLFFGAGRKIVLEALTQAERNLLYQARDLARFRQQLFTDVVATNGAISYLGLLQTRQLIINQEENLRRLQQQVFKLQSNAERGKVVPSAFLEAVQATDRMAIR